MTKKFCAILEADSGQFRHEVLDLPPGQDEAEAIEEVLDIRSVDSWQVLIMCEENAEALEKAASDMRELLAKQVRKNQA